MSKPGRLVSEQHDGGLLPSGGGTSYCWGRHVLGEWETQPLERDEENTGACVCHLIA